ncbi:MAG: Trm112 family protein [Chloroflexota bacterium]|nr:Trm112 family protein [Chloroflexota bacterium]
MPVARELLEILACPVDHAHLTEQGDRLVCSSCGRRYPVRDDIPVMLVDEAELPGGASPAR